MAAYDTYLTKRIPQSRHINLRHEIISIQIAFYLILPSWRESPSKIRFSATLMRHGHRCLGIDTYHYHLMIIDASSRIAIVSCRTLNGSFISIEITSAPSQFLRGACLVMLYKRTEKAQISFRRRRLKIIPRYQLPRVQLLSEYASDDIFSTRRIKLASIKCRM